MFGLFEILKISFRRMIYGKKTLLLCGLWILSAFGIFLIFLSKNIPKPISIVNTTHILWWTRMPDNYKSTRYCNLNKCTFSSNRDKLAESSAVLFYASDLKLHDFPLPRLSKHLWALLHEESPRNVLFLPYANVLQHFNLSSTFSRYSNFPLTTQYLPDIRDLVSPTYLITVGEKSNQRMNRAPIAFLQSDCDTMSSRDEYVQELMRYIDIDSYGKCLHNRDLPKHLQTDYLNKLYSPELYRFLAGYKFILAYENGICDDYITEKFWRPLIIGVVPIYYGSPTIKDWQPNNKSVIHIPDFAGPKALADFIKKLDENNYEYNTYLNHKYEQLEPITNLRLVHALSTREHSIVGDSLFGAFECFVCESLNAKALSVPSIVTTRHYNCSQPLAHPAMENSNITNGNWPAMLAMGVCQARILDKLLRLNKTFTEQQFKKLLMIEVEAFRC